MDSDPLSLRSPALPRLRGLSQRGAFPVAWIGIVGVVSLMSITAMVGFMAITADQAKLNDSRLVSHDMSGLLLALIDAETGVRGFVLTGQVEYLEPYEWGTRALQALPQTLIGDVDRFAAAQPGADGDLAPFSHHLANIRTVWSTAISKVSGHDIAAGEATLETMHGKRLMDSLRSDIGGFVAARDAIAVQAEDNIAREQNWVLLLNLAGGIAAISALVYASLRSLRDAARRERAVAGNVQARRQIELLLVMAEMLQSALDRDDANAVLRASAAQLLPGLQGALYIFNNSRDRLDLSTNWAADGSEITASNRPDFITPNGCWALKRGKPHRNDLFDGALRCEHAPSGQASLEIPMSARGELYGLLELTAIGENAEARMQDVRLIAGALADAMSLALSNISLRERLHNQALRDPLTGLYNRRFLEEMLDRLANDADRKQTPLSAMMIDLDHFKLVNDKFGHATGDAVLRQVAITVMAALRSTDVACRYGGEELAILMPDCSVEIAVAKAEQIRAAIADMSKDGRVPPISASIGVASTPEIVALASDMIAAADAALYQAKQQGRDRVVAGTPRGQSPKLVIAG